MVMVNMDTFYNLQPNMVREIFFNCLFGILALSVESWDHGVPDLNIADFSPQIYTRNYISHDEGNFRKFSYEIFNFYKISNIIKTYLVYLTPITLTD